MRIRLPLLLIPAAFTLLLAGCGSTPVHTSSPTASTPTSKPAKGGGYYQDDGPGDNPPENIAAIPDAVPKDEPLQKFSNRPYEVMGQTYVPDTSATSYRARGIASWYGRKFNGKRTASGEPYDMYGMTAAHRTLPIPSYARVTNTATGKSVIVRINDRGPFHSNRLIDLSYTAAYKLGLVGNGSGEVTVERVLPGQTPAADSLTAQTTAAPAVNVAAQDNNSNSYAATEPAASGIMLQLGAFGVAESANRLRSKVQNTLTELSQAVTVISQNGMHKVRIGPYSDRQSAELMAERIRTALSISPVIVIQ